MGKKNLVSINDFSRDEILKIMDLAARLRPILISRYWPAKSSHRSSSSHRPAHG